MQLVQALVEGQLDMVVGSRVNRNRQTLRWGRHWGNRLLTAGVRALFGHALHDVFFWLQGVFAALCQVFCSARDGL